MSAPLIVNACLSGMVPTKADNPAVPVTPDEIADDVERVVAAGASIVHLHARDENGAPTYRREVYADIIGRVRERCPDVIVVVSTSGRTFKAFEERADVLDLTGDLKPDMASLTLGSLNFPKQAVANEPEMIRRLAERMRERGIVPELEVFDLGMVDYAIHLIERGVLDGSRPYFNILLGSLGTLSATPLNLALTVQALPAGAVWAGAGIGRYQFAMTAQAVTMGGHVRVGLEDNLFLGVKERPATNVALVERIVALGRAFEREPAQPAEARAALLSGGRTLLRS
ncbi:MAG TPA: 3-keto-5-aminohexanoate cleavage protein [Gaiellaceae bacterium]|nr:3-keto-5-aminohexanoate cleavage protein [Gaiellaceae bacterium]